MITRIIMARELNPDNPYTTLKVSKHLKVAYLNRLRKQDGKRKNGYENDDKTLKWILEMVFREHPELIHDPKTTY